MKSSKVMRIIATVFACWLVFWIVLSSISRTTFTHSVLNDDGTVDRIIGVNAEVLEVHDGFILAYGLGNPIHGSFTFNHSHLPDIEVFVGANLVLTIEPTILESYPAVVSVLDWWHALSAFNVEVLEITEDWFLVQDVTDARRFELINYAELPDIGANVGDLIEIVIRSGDFADVDPTPISVLEWSIREN